MTLIARLTAVRRFAVAPLCLAAAVVLFSMTTPEFLTFGNATSIATQMWVLALLAIGQMFVIVTRGFDISVGALAALSSTVSAMAVNAFGLIGLVVGVLVGLLSGTVTGYLIGRLEVQPIVTTLGMLIGLRGLALLITGNGQVVPLHDATMVSHLAFDPVFGLPPLTWMAIAIAVIAAGILGWTTLGRRLLMLGSNPEAAHLVGIDPVRTYIRAYQLCGAFAGLAGIFILMRAGTGLPTDGSGMELRAIAAALIGGTAFSGGVASVTGVVLGAAFIQVLLTGLNLQGMSPFFAQMVVGTVIIGSGFLGFITRGLQSSFQTGERT